MFGINLRVLRFFIGWMFAFSSLVCMILAFWLVRRAFEGHGLNVFTYFRALLLQLIFPVAATVFGIAWWTIWKEKPSSRGWGIAASALTMLFPLRHIILLPRTIWSHSGVVLAFGIVGLIVFPKRNETASSMVEANTDNCDPENNSK
jgi:hypothetical protein